MLWVDKLQKKHIVHMYIHVFTHTHTYIASMLCKCISRFISKWLLCSSSLWSCVWMHACGTERTAEEILNAEHSNNTYVSHGSLSVNLIIWYILWHLVMWAFNTILMRIHVYESSPCRGLHMVPLNDDHLLQLLHFSKWNRVLSIVNYYIYISYVCTCTLT